MSFSNEMDHLMYEMKISEGGRVVIPAPIRRSLDLNEGDTVVWDILNGEVHLSTRKKQLEKARALFQKSTPPGTQPQLVKDFLNERRSETERDEPA
jgi:AbrB family looped-hinge helix DNA binding protein